MVRMVNFIALVVLLLFSMIFISIGVIIRDNEDKGAFIDEPSAHRLYEKMKKTLYNTESLYCEGLSSKESRGNEYNRCSYKIWMKKPNYARIEQIIDKKTMAVLVGDGKYFWTYWSDKRPYNGDEDTEEYLKFATKRYLKKPIPSHHSLAHEFGSMGYGGGMTILELSLFYGYNDSLEPHIDGVKGLGKEIICNDGCSMIEVSYLHHQRSRYYWISENSSLPRKMEETVRVKYEIKAYDEWVDIKINENMDLSLFSWNPPQGWKEWQPVKLEKGLLTKGTYAPDFDLQLIDGGKFRLSGYRGKIVWIVFWRVG